MFDLIGGKKKGKGRSRSSGRLGRGGEISLA